VDEPGDFREVGNLEYLEAGFGSGFRFGHWRTAT
jgi:hypothetical protein